MSEYQHIYLSPHFDDAALSCGGMICAQTRAGARVLIVTLCAGFPDYSNLSEFARFQHNWWGNPPDPVGQRRREDACAASILGAELRYLDSLDAIYRRHPVTDETLYNSDEEIFGPLHSADVLSAAAMAAAWQEALPLAGARLYAPLAVGNHVDHQLARAAAIALAEKGASVTFYEDFPYAANADALVRALANPAPGGWRARHIALTLDELERKKQAIACYVSQNPVIFRHGPGMDEQVAEYALRVGEGRPAERLWDLVIG